MLYPYFLAIPLWIAATLGIDSQAIVRAAPYISNTVLVIISDYYFYKLGKKMFGIQAARIAFILYFTNCFFNEYLIRCFGNSFESVLHIVVFYYFIGIT